MPYRRIKELSEPETKTIEGLEIRFRYFECKNSKGQRFFERLTETKKLNLKHRLNIENDGFFEMCSHFSKIFPASKWESNINIYNR